jgi:hypothetical protein
MADATRTEAGAATPTPVEAARAFGVMLGGSALLVGGGAATLSSAARALLSGRRPSRLALAGSAAVALYLAAGRPWLASWGASREERARPLPGDELTPDPGVQTTRAVTIDAPAEQVWPWLAQIGQDRGGFYSYEWLENLAGCRMRNADRVHREWQHREVGETVLLAPSTGLELALFEPNRSFGFAGWYLNLEPDHGQTRLLARGRAPRGVASVAYALLLELPHFIMERKMLLGIKARAERDGGGTRSRPGSER